MRSLTAAVAAALVLLPAAPALAAPNQAPVAVDDAIDLQGFAGVGWALPVLDNDSDPDGDPLTFTSVTPATLGDTYLAAGQLFFRTRLGVTGTEPISYTVSDGQGNTATATVTVTVWADLPAPTGFAIGPADTGSATLTWPAVPDADQYQVFRGNTLATTTSALTWTDTGLAADSQYVYRVASVNGGGFGGPRSTPVFRQPQSRALSGPAVELTGDPTALSLTWSAGDQLGPWNVYRDGVLLTTRATPDLLDTGLVSGRAYGYQVQVAFPPTATQVYPASPLSPAVTATPSPLTPIGRFVLDLGGPTGDLGPVTAAEHAVPGGRRQDHRYATILQRTGEDPVRVWKSYATQYDRAGGVAALGFPLDPGVCGLRDEGCAQFFDGGSIWSSAHFWPAAVVPQVIEDGWAASGWEEGELGYPSAEFRAVRGGFAQEFEDGAVYWSPATGSRAVSGPIHELHKGSGGVNAWLALPLTDEICGLAGGGCAQVFQGGVVYWGPGTGAHAVSGSFRETWTMHGGEGGRFGYPMSGVNCWLAGGGCFQQFQGGTMFWSPGTGAHPVTGSIGQTWVGHGRESGKLGYPTSGENCWLPGGGCFQLFQGGSIYWSPGTGAHVVLGAVRDTWGANGWEAGKLGYPTSGEICGLIARGCFQQFQGGSIYWSPGTGAHVVLGAVRDTWGRQGWETGRLRYPVTSEICGLRGGGCFQAFQGGSIYWSPGTGAHVVLGAIRDTWGRQGWEGGRLGYPVSSESPTRDGAVQTFQGGTIAWVAGRAKVTYR